MLVRQLQDSVDRLHGRHLLVNLGGVQQYINMRSAKLLDHALLVGTEHLTPDWHRKELGRCNTQDVSPYVYHGQPNVEQYHDTLHRDSTTGV